MSEYSTQKSDKVEYIDDQLIVSQAKQFIKDRFEKGKHHVACVLYTSNDVYRALHLDSNGFDICAEPIAIGQAIVERAESLLKIVSVHWTGNLRDEPTVVSPCGNCAQLMAEIAPALEVLVNTGDQIKSVRAEDLLPYRYQKPCAD